jgi:hypothetical protein
MVNYWRDTGNCMTLFTSGGPGESSEEGDPAIDRATRMGGK